MGVLKGLKDFLFGRDPDIFDEKGFVRHKFPQEKWKNWQDRFEKNPQYDWQHHTGIEGTARPNRNTKH